MLSKTAQAAIPKCHKPSGLTTDIYFSWFWSWKSKVSVLANSVPGERLSSQKGTNPITRAPKHLLGGFLQLSLWVTLTEFLSGEIGVSLKTVIHKDTTAPQRCPRI